MFVSVPSCSLGFVYFWRSNTVHIVFRTQMELARGFLQHVTKTHPECGLAVLPLAQKLLPYNTNSSPEFEGFKSEGRSNEEFLIKLCTALASKVPNAFEVNDPSSLPWKMMPLIPLPKEIQSYSKFLMYFAFLLNIFVLCVSALVCRSTITRSRTIQAFISY